MPFTCCQRCRRRRRLRMAETAASHQFCGRCSAQAGGPWSCLREERCNRRGPRRAHPPAGARAPCDIDSEHIVRTIVARRGPQWETVRDHTRLMPERWRILVYGHAHRAPDYQESGCLRGKACIAGHRVRVLDVLVWHEHQGMTRMRSSRTFHPHSRRCSRGSRLLFRPPRRNPAGDAGRALARGRIPPQPSIPVGSERR